MSPVEVIGSIQLSPQELWIADVSRLLFIGLE
jgi:hypothetical protein